MANTFGTGEFAVYVEWNTGNEKTMYRYESKDTRDRKLKEFRKNKKVKNATPAWISKR